jgi:hypothetical protein
MVTWIAKKSTCLHGVHANAKAMYYGGMADHAAAIATTMPKENEADITVLVSKTERAERSQAGRPWSL